MSFNSVPAVVYACNPDKAFAYVVARRQDARDLKADMAKGPLPYAKFEPIGKSEFKLVEKSGFELICADFNGVLAYILARFW